MPTALIADNIKEKRKEALHNLISNYEQLCEVFSTEECRCILAELTVFVPKPIQLLQRKKKA